MFYIVKKFVHDHLKAHDIHVVENFQLIVDERDELRLHRQRRLVFEVDVQVSEPAALIDFPQATRFLVTDCEYHAVVPQPHSPEFLAYHDAVSGQHRVAAFDGARLLGALFVAPSPVAASRSWAAEKLRETFIGPAERLHVLAGRAGGATKDKGAIVCACFEVGINQIAEAGTGVETSVDRIGELLGAGTNCGSCRPEIRSVLDDIRLSKAV